MKPIYAFNPRQKNPSTGEVEKKYHRGYAGPATAERILSFLCPHYAQFRNNHRAQADILPEAFTHCTCVDVDDKELVDDAIRKALEVNKDPMSDWEDMVEYIEYSARKKIHLWIRIPKGMTIEEAQRAFCKEIGIPYDESCITPERFIYMTGDEVYRSPRWLQPLSEEDISERREAYLLRAMCHFDQVRCYARRGRTPPEGTRGKASHEVRNGNYEGERPVA